jgi:hypothetical protein
MEQQTPESRRFARLGLALGCLLLAVAACGKPAPHKKGTVTGKLTVGDKPVTVGQVRFFADTSKGNTAAVICIGQVGAQGEYELVTDRGDDMDIGPGVPLGWYKVVYSPPKKGPPAKVDERYTKLTTTPLELEVVENPEKGRYDIDLK